MPRFIIFVVLCALALAAEESPQSLKTNIGVLALDIQGGGPEFAAEAMTAIQQSLMEVGAYQIFSPEAMAKAYEGIGLKMPGHCREPRCAAAIGNDIKMDRMIYGSIDKNEKSVAVALTLIDVPSKQIVESVALEGGPGVALVDVMKTAVQEIHGQRDKNVNSNTHTYYGPQVHNEKQLLISAPACIAAGVIMGLANGSVTGKDNNSNSVERDYSSFEGDRENMFGIGTGADRIPMFGRPNALANCYVAASDDAYGVFFNPAGLSWIGGAEASVGYQYRFAGLSNIAGSYVNKATREIGFGQGILYSGDKLQSEMYFVSAVSYKFNELVSFLRPLSLGASVKVLTKWTGKGASESSSTGSSFGFGLDLGLKWELTENIHYGLLFKNVPSFGHWNNTLTDTSYGETSPATLAMGGTFQANYATFLICEGHIPLNEDQPWVFAGAVERELFGLLKIRAGIEKMADFNTPWLYTGGLGFKVMLNRKYVILDVSYQYNTLAVFAHPVNVSMRFGF
jgi:opacity protein-like surface antigen